MKKPAKLIRAVIIASFTLTGVSTSGIVHASKESKTDLFDKKTNRLKDGDQGDLKKDTPVEKINAVEKPKEVGRDKSFDPKRALARQKQRIEKIRAGRVKVNLKALK